MPTRDEIIQQINDEIESAVDAFNDAMPSMEKSLVRKINVIIKDLDLGADGTIKATIKNLKKMRMLKLLKC